MTTLQILGLIAAFIGLIVFAAMAILAPRDGQHESCKAAEPAPDPVSVDDIANIGATTEPPAPSTTSAPILSVCAWCHPAVIAAATDAGMPISHGLCPACQRLHFPSTIPTDKPLRNFKLGGASHG